MQPHFSGGEVNIISSPTFVLEIERPEFSSTNLQYGEFEWKRFCDENRVMSGRF